MSSTERTRKCRAKKKAELETQNQLSNSTQESAAEPHPGTSSLQHEPQHSASQHITTSHPIPNQQRVATNRETQNAEKRKTRQENDSQNKRQKRLKESIDASGRKADKTRKAVNRAEEDEEATARRRQQDAARHAEVLQAETLDEHEERNRQRRLQRAVRKAKTYRQALDGIQNDAQVPLFDIGEMDQVCKYCKADFFFRTF